MTNSLYKEGIADSRLHELLKTLTNYGFVVKTGGVFATGPHIEQVGDKAAAGM